MGVDIAASSALTAGKPRERFRRPDTQVCSAVRCDDISADGQRFLLRDLTTVQRASVTGMDLVLNWTATRSNGRRSTMERVFTCDGLIRPDVIHCVIPRGMNGNQDCQA